MSDNGTPRHDGRAKILRTLSRSGPLSRAELARQTVLAPSTVSGLVNDLTAEGLVIEVDGDVAPPAGTRRGRPGTLLTLHADTGIVVGVDFGKTHVRVAAADLAHRVLGEARRVITPDAAAGDHIAEAQNLVAQVVAGADRSESDVVGMATGLPGPVRHTTGALTDATILPGWRGLDAVAALSDAFGRPVAVDNDANLGCLGEWMWGAARGYTDVIYVKASSGVGAGLILDNDRFVGAGGIAGELGHVVVDPTGPRCRCGSVGCLEMRAGTEAVRAQVARRSANPADPPSVEEVVAAAHSGHRAAGEALREAGHWIGLALAGVCNVLNPQVVVIGGHLAPAGDVLVRAVRSSLAEAAMSTIAADLSVRQGSFGPRAEVMGALALALRSSRPLGG